MEALLDLVVITYQAPQETGAFFRSLKTVDVPFTLTVVENNSPDPAVKDVINAHVGEVSALPNCVGLSVVYNQENVGYAKAANQGATYGSAPFLVILNADTKFLDNGCASKIVEFFQSDESVGVVGPFTTDDTGRITHAGIVIPPGSNRQSHRAWQSQATGDDFREVMDVKMVSGATFFVRRAAWDQMTECPEYQVAAPGAEGALLPTPHFYEETFCCYHAAFHGWRVVYYGPAMMIHEWHRSSPVGSKPLAEARAMFFAACRSHGISTEGEGDE